MSIDPTETNAFGSSVHVTCVMITRPIAERLHHAKRSISDYCAQSHPAKDLLVIANGGTASGRDALLSHAASLGRDDIQLHFAPDELNLGQLRNLSMEMATGEVLCQWDDDDLSHLQRLELQLAHLLSGNYEATYLQDVMQYFPSEQRLYWTNWRATEASAHPGTLMLRRDAPVRYPVEGTTARLGEDLVLAKALMARGPIGYLSGRAELFIYVSHGSNSWPDGHHRMLVNTLAISQALLRRREPQLRSGLSCYGFAAGTVALCGSNGHAFTY